MSGRQRTANTVCVGLVSGRTYCLCTSYLLMYTLCSSQHNILQQCCYQRHQGNLGTGMACDVGQGCKLVLEYKYRATETHSSLLWYVLLGTVLSAF